MTRFHRSRKSTTRRSRPTNTSLARASRSAAPNRRRLVRDKDYDPPMTAAAPTPVRQKAGPVANRSRKHAPRALPARSSGAGKQSTNRSRSQSGAPTAGTPLTARSKRELRELQRAMLAVVMNPLTRANRTASRLSDGRATRAAAAQIAKPNDRLTAFERLEIYNRMYWFRVLDSLHEDCPALRAVLGERRFLRLIEAFLQELPSCYWTLRDLPQRLPAFIRAHPGLTAPHTALAADAAKFEWAQVEVYDGAAFPVFTLDDLRGANPARLRLSLQPYLQLLELRYPVDEFALAIRKREALLRGDASNAPTELRRRANSLVRLPRAERCCVAVHRHEGRIYFKRLEPAAFRVLAAIRAGQPLARALAAALPWSKNPPEDWAAKVQDWFRTWMELGWFGRRRAFRASARGG
ncbi:MAG: DUF2063 domain-containing protein [Opitutus sp.]|nr:DUF2063 domain-containing protein [Opitutus sp.]